MEDLQRLYPIGIQTFSKIREGNYLYIDKTAYVYRMTHSASSYMFLSRPRRFGKSLLTSTLHSYFSGRKELFHGLAMEKLEKEWTEYPVLHFDMSMAKHVDKGGLERLLDFMLAEYERTFAINAVEGDANLRLVNLIKRAYEQTGKKVVVLIDEYDAPLLDVVHESENLGVLRNIMRNFYSPLKACDPYLQYVFLTGITKFSQLSIFSELNNIENISMDEPYAAICGISEDEIRSQMKGDVDGLAKKMGITPEEVLKELKDNYDGYHFTYPSPDIYNPFSLLTAMEKGKIGSYWFGSGTPTYLINMLKKFGVEPSEIGNNRVSVEDFDAPTERMTSIIPLLYQSGYITIKNYDEELDLYTLNIPNKEVRIGLMKSLLPHYVGSKAPETTTMVAYLSRDIRNGGSNGLRAAAQRSDICRRNADAPVTAGIQHGGEGICADSHRHGATGCRTRGGAADDLRLGVFRRVDHIIACHRVDGDDRNGSIHRQVVINRGRVSGFVAHRRANGVVAGGQGA